MLPKNVKYLLNVSGNIQLSHTFLITQIGPIKYKIISSHRPTKTLLLQIYLYPTNGSCIAYERCAVSPVETGGIDFRARNIKLSYATSVV